ncbi:MAG: hypothetical protein ABFS18_02770 [Thermodesulfobacteriota bacterium]
MEDILKEIKNVPAVMGSYIHVSGTTTVHSDLPKIFQNKVYDVGEAVDRIIKVNEATNMRANNIEFNYEEAIIIIRPINSDASLITFCESGVNKKTLNMTTGMLSSELKEAANRIRSNVAPAKKPKPAAAPTAKPEVDVNKILHVGPLAKVFQDFQNAFAMAIGPIGEMVMKDTVEEWAKNGDCSGERLAELVEMLCKEIDDKSLEEEFKGAVSQHLN